MSTEFETSYPGRLRGSERASSAVEDRPKEASEGIEQDRRLGISVLVPVAERPEPLDELYRIYAPAVAEIAETYEFLFLVPAHAAHTLEPLKPLRDGGEPIRILEVGAETSEAALLRAGVARAVGDLLLTLPAYHRIDPEGIPRLVQAVHEGADLAVARRFPRRDSWVNRVQSGVFHLLLRGMTGDRIHDTACGVRAMKRGVLKRVPLYGDFTRFLPVLARREGYRVREVDAPQHPADTDPRVYSPGIYVRRLIDLLGLFFLTRFTYKPLRFFGLVGSGLGGLGGLVLLVVGLQRLGGQPLADRPLLVLGVLLATLGVQAFALGLVGEIIVHFNAPNRPGYRVLTDEDDA